MYNRFKLTILFAASLCLTLPAAHADPSASVRKVLQGLYKAQDTAAVHKDVADFFKYVAPGATFTIADGHSVTYQQLHNVMANIFAKATKVSSVTTIVSCTVKGNNATVISKSQTSFTVVNPQTNKPITLADSGTSRDSWEKSASGWHLKLVHSLTTSETMNGKPMK